MHELLRELPEQQKKNIRPSPQPDWMEPMLATLTDRRFSDAGWIFEQKFDGERCLIFRKGEKIRLLSRNRNRLNETYPELEAACAEIKEDSFIADGEIVALAGGVPSFSLLQNRMQISDRDRARRSSVPVFLYLFDLMYVGAYDITGVELRYRKAVLGRLFSSRDPLRFTPHREEQGEACYREACRKGWEGIIAKRAASRYVHHRSPDWLKFKCVNQQEFVIGGFTDPAGSRIGFGALLIGYYDGKDLVYAGRVGTGFDDRLLSALKERLLAIEKDTSPFSDRKRGERGEHWVEPELVCEVAFTEWTHAGLLRHPRFLGLRDDKAPGDVVKETSR
jgi:bifunctional non-homologous end joining protein LigD